MHGCGWDSGAARERSSALAASVASRYATRSAPKAGALRARAPTCAPRVTAHVVSWGEWGCRRRRVLRAAREARCKACFELLPRARVGWHTARTLLPPPPPRSSGAPVRWLMARGRRASGVAAAPRSLAPPARRPRAAGAPWEARARAARVQTAGEDLVVGGGGGGVVVRTPTPNYLRLASPDRGKYCRGVHSLRAPAARSGATQSRHEATRSVSSVMGLAMRLTHENRRKLGATVVAAVLMALGPVLVTQSKVDGEYEYSVPVCNLLAEIMKLCISATFLAVSHGLCREPSAEPPAPQHGRMCPWPRSGSARTQRSRRPPDWAGLPHG